MKVLTWEDAERHLREHLENRMPVDALPSRIEDFPSSLGVFRFVVRWPDDRVSVVYVGPRGGIQWAYGISRDELHVLTKVMG